MRRWPKVVMIFGVAALLLLSTIPVWANDSAPGSSVSSTSSQDQSFAYPGESKQRFKDRNYFGKQGFGRNGMHQGMGRDTFPQTRCLDDSMKAYIEQYPEYFAQLEEVRDQRISLRQETRTVMRDIFAKLREARQEGNQDAVDQIKASLEEIRGDRPLFTPEERQAHREEMRENHEAFIKALEEGDETAIQEHIDLIKARQLEQQANMQEHLNRLKDLLNSLN